jgi:methionine salvage enolase-phosphatase E1
MMQGALAVAGTTLGERDVVDLVDGEAAHVVLRRMAQIVSERSRTDKTYKDKDVNAVAKALSEYCGLVVTAAQVYNHLRKWKQKWSKIARLKNLSGALFDEDVQAKMLEQDHYLGHCKVQNHV